MRVTRSHRCSTTLFLYAAFSYADTSLKNMHETMGVTPLHRCNRFSGARDTTRHGHNTKTVRVAQSCVLTRACSKVTRAVQPSTARDAAMVAMSLPQPQRQTSAGRLC